MNKLIALVAVASLASGCPPGRYGDVTGREIVAGAAVVVGISLVLHGIIFIAKKIAPRQANAPVPILSRDDDHPTRTPAEQSWLTDATNRAVHAAAADDCNEVVRLAKEIRSRLGSDAANDLERGDDTVHCFLGRDALRLGIDYAVRTADCPTVRRLTKRLGTVDPEALTRRIEADAQVRACLAPPPAAGPAVQDPNE